MIRISKYEFSREDYEMYKSFFENRLDKLEIVSIDSVKQKHDKTFKEILTNKKEMIKFLEQFIEMEVKEKEIEKHNSSFINKHYERRESDIIYKIKNRDIYYLIEHQSTVDKKMPKRILEYCMEIMREIQENKKEVTNPLIVPIVIEWIKDLVEYVFPEILGEDMEIILKIIEEKERKNMQDLVERIKKYEERREKRLRGEGRKEGLEAGRKEGIKETITNMLMLNQDDELIMKCTKAKKEEIEKIKKELKLQPN